MTSLARRLATSVGTSVGAVAVAASLAGCAAVAGVSDPPTATVGGAVSGPRAETLAAQVVETAQQADAKPGADGDALRERAYTGDALTAARADARLAPTRTQAQRDALALAPGPPVVLAVSSGLAYPRSMVVRTTRAKSGLPVLSLLVTPDVRTPFKIAATAQMLPGAQVPAFDPLAQGSPALGDGSGLAVTPGALLSAYAASLAFPAPPASDGRPFVDDAFSVSLRAAAKDQAAKLAAAGAFGQQHQAKDVVGGLRLAGARGALAFAVMTRQDVIRNTSNATVAVPAPFQALTGLSSVTREASLDSLEFVALVIPDRGQAQVVGAEEHLLAARGS